MMSYLSENEAKSLQNGDIHFIQIPGISRTIWRNEVGDGSFFAFFTLFNLSLAHLLTGVSH